NRDVGAGVTNTAGIYDFDLIRSPNQAQVENSFLGIKYMSTVPVYQLKEWGTKLRDQIVTPTGPTTFTVQYQAPQRPHPISAYWVPWSSGSCWSVQLGNAADYFFTPTMDGCCLSISGGVSPIVTHANYKNTLNPTVADESLTMSKIRGHHHITLGGNVNRSL